MATFTELAAAAQVHLNEAKQALRALEALLGSEVSREAEQNITPLDIHLRLLLVNRPVSVGVIAGWSREDRQAVAEWALAEAYAASDNNVAVPPEPAVLMKLQAEAQSAAARRSGTLPPGYIYRDPPYDDDGAGPYVLKLTRDGEDVDVSEEPVLATRDWESEELATQELVRDVRETEAEERENAAWSPPLPEDNERGKTDNERFR